MSNDFMDPEASHDAIDVARRHAKTRAPIGEPIKVLSEAELEAPIGPAEIEGSIPAIPPIRIQGYQLVEEIGSGGQATVFRAVKESTGRMVALKVLPGGPLAGQRARSRFEREAEILAKLDHPNVVRIIDRCETLDGSLVLVMDCIEGARLDEAWKIAPHAGYAREVAVVFASICDGVGEVHKHNIVHRDLKPSNILIDRHGYPRVLDFGLAQLSVHRPGLTLTGPGQMVGSLPWASPEQVSSRGSETLPASTDVYSIGVMLYQALTGCPPYVTTGSIHEVITAIQRTSPVPAHTVNGAREKGVDAQLGQIVSKALSKKVEERYPNAAELAADLRRWIAGHRPVANYAERARRARRWKFLFAVAAAITIVVFVGLVLAPFHDEPVPSTAISPIALPHMTNSIGMEFVQIPRGSVSVGSPLNLPEHRDDEQPTVAKFPEPFWMSTHEVTRGEYRRVMGALPEQATPNLPDGAPVDGVTYFEATKFCQRLSDQTKGDYRIPSAWEWEYACRDTSRYQSYSGTGRIDDMGWYAGNSGMSLHPVGQKAPNSYGLFDMHGNVAEWTDDPYYKEFPARAEPNTREVRGGSATDPREGCRTAARSFRAPDTATAGIGFRVVMHTFSTPTTASTTSAQKKSNEP